MNNLTTLSLAELQQLLKDVQTEIKEREKKGNSFDLEFSISNKKAYQPATYKQYELAISLAEKTNSVIAVSSSQVCKRMEIDEISDAIDAMKEGKRVHIY